MHCHSPARRALPWLLLGVGMLMPVVHGQPGEPFKSGLALLSRRRSAGTQGRVLFLRACIICNSRQILVLGASCATCSPSCSRACPHETSWSIPRETSTMTDCHMLSVCLCAYAGCPTIPQATAGQVVYTTPNLACSFVPPAGVTSVSVVCVGGGGGAGRYIPFQNPATAGGGSGGGGGEGQQTTDLEHSRTVLGTCCVLLTIR